MVPPEIELVAHELFSFMPASPTHERVDDKRFVLHFNKANPLPTYNCVQRIRLADAAVAEAVEEVRRFFRERGREWISWWISPTATPRRLAETLRALGLVPSDDPTLEPRYEAMALVEPPQAAPPDVEAHRIETVEEARVAAEIHWEVTGVPDEVREQQRQQLEERWRPSETRADYLALVDGEPVGMAVAYFLEHAVALTGGAVLPAARGRGAYRALVRARWDDGVARGTPALATQAGRMSRPILERTGFQSLGTVDVLLDDLAHSRAS